MVGEFGGLHLTRGIDRDEYDSNLKKKKKSASKNKSRIRYLYRVIH